MSYTPQFTPAYEGGWKNKPYETTPIQASALNAYDQAIEHVEDYLASDNSQANLADAYDENATYEAGDYRIHNGNLYKCLEDIDEPEEWDSTKWERCLITDEMATSVGTTVIANPSGTATDTLTKLQVENTIYGISGGGGNANIWTGTQAELEEVFDELEEGTQINITDDEQEVVEGGTIYSEEEQVIGLWKNNKPLYQKTFVTEKTNILGNSDIDITSDITAISTDEIIAYNNHLIYTYTSGGSTTTGEYWSDDLARLAVVSNGYVIRLTIGGATLDTVKVVWTITYTKASDAPLDAVVGKSTMYIASSDCYSTEEKEIGVFADGKPLYQKTIYSSGGNLTSGQIIISNDLANIDHVASWKCVTHDTARDRYYCLDHNRLDATEDVRLQVYIASDDTVALVILVSKTTFLTAIGDTWITLQYTKTTDTAGSGSYTPASGKAVHYSTDEQVIGTWIDGKPLYRRTITGLSIQLNGTTWVNYNPSISIDKLINVHAYYEPSGGLMTCAIAEYQYNSSAGIQLTAVQGYNRTVNTLTIEYTKTTV